MITDLEILRIQSHLYTERNPLGEIPLVEGPITINNMNLYALPIEHDKTNWTPEVAQITQSTIAAADIVVPEYFPPEYEHLYADPVVGPTISHYKDYSNYAFECIKEMLREGKKDVYVVDPAHSISFSKLDYAWLIPTVLSLGISSGALLNLGLGLKPENRLSRRDFLLKAALATIGLASLNWLLQNDPNDFRRVVVADNFHKLSTKVPQRSDVLTIYPPAHWQGIEQFLLDDQLRNSKIQLYQSLFKMPRYEELYRIRHYKSDGNSWSAV